MLALASAGQEIELLRHNHGDNFRAAFDLDECGDEARLAWKTLRAPQLKGRSCGKIGKRALLHREEPPGDVIAEG